MPENTTLNGRILRWLCTAVCLAVSVALAIWVVVRGLSVGLSPTEALWPVVRGTGEMMLYLVPLWTPDVAVGVVPSVSKWLRVICGAIGIGIGLAVAVGLAATRTSAAFLVAVALMYLALGAYNCWLSSRRPGTTSAPLKDLPAAG